MSVGSNFDRLAWTYDPLVRMVFGHSMVESQTHFLDRIAPGSSVLIVGGGTGWILDELFAQASNCEVWYVEASEKMLRKSRRRGISGKVHFILGDWKNLPAQKFDVVVTNYFLDLFTDQTLAEVIRVIGDALNTGGMWLVTDFTQSRKWHAAMLAAMYLFFRALCRIEASNLPAWEEAMSRAGFRPAASKFTYSGFMKSVLFRRLTDVPDAAAFGQA